MASSFVRHHRSLWHVPCFLTA